MPGSGYTAITFVANEQPTTAKWNLIGSNFESLVDGSGFDDFFIENRHISELAVEGMNLGPMIACRAKRTTAQTIPNNTTTFIALNAEDFDTAAMHDNSSSNHRITAPEGGLYLVNFHMEWANNLTGRRFTLLEKNAATPATSTFLQYVSVNPVVDGRVTASGSCLVSMVAGDFVTMCAYQNSGGNLDTGVVGPLFMEAIRIGSL